MAGRGLKEAPRDREMCGQRPSHRAEGQILRPPRGPGQASPEGPGCSYGSKRVRLWARARVQGARGRPRQWVTCSQEPGFAVSS